MFTCEKRTRASVASLGAITLITIFGSAGVGPSDGPPHEIGIGDLRGLQAAYLEWAADYSRVGDQTLILSLGYVKGLSAEFTSARGSLTLDLRSGSLSVDVSGLVDGHSYDVWMVDNRPGPGRSVKPEPGDAAFHIGSLIPEGGTAILESRLNAEDLAEFEMDLVVIAPAGNDLPDASLLVGSPSFFQRVYHGARSGPVALLADYDQRTHVDSDRSGPLASVLEFAVPSPAYAASGEPADGFLIELGEELFFEERFDGNGRTCGTCHPAENNFTIDPVFIAELPPDDPLFVAEFNPVLAELEKPELMRAFGLILENVDGLDDPTNKFVMRGVPHTLALSTSIGLLGNRTGWSADGAPGNGTLREFAIGAVTQHFTKNLMRRPEIDFRLPTEAELDALEAFQLSLGRQHELDLNSLNLEGDAPRRGLEIFKSAEARCTTCHVNAGANGSFDPDNPNFDTGVEELVDPPGRLLADFPIDGGFGHTPENPDGSFGDGTFNTPSLVEAADTGPFFHNNAVATLEGAVAFFNGSAFNNSPAGAFGQISLEPTQIEALAAFLRVINALENIRSSIAYIERLPTLHDRSRHDRLYRATLAELEDAIQVLQMAGLHPDAMQLLKRAKRLVVASRGHAKPLLRRAISRAEAARELMAADSG